MEEPRRVENTNEDFSKTEIQAWYKRWNRYHLEVNGRPGGAKQMNGAMTETKNCTSLSAVSKIATRVVAESNIQPLHYDERHFRLHKD